MGEEIIINGVDISSCDLKQYCSQAGYPVKKKY